MSNQGLFVYGTLLRNEKAHYMLSGARFLGEARTEEGYGLIDLGAYPGLVKTSSGHVLGEVYQVDRLLLAQLDVYEGHPVLFRRVGLSLKWSDPREFFEVEGYLYDGDAADGLRLYGGDWRERDSAC